MMVAGYHGISLSRRVMAAAEGFGLTCRASTAILLQPFKIQRDMTARKNFSNGKAWVNLTIPPSSYPEESSEIGL